MKSKWSKILKADHTTIRIESVTMDTFPDPDPPMPPPEGNTESESRMAEEPALEAHDCARLQHEAFESGYAKGLEEGRAQMRAQAEAELAQALTLATQAGLAHLRALRDAEHCIVELALAVARKVIRREVTIDKDTVAKQVHHIVHSLTRSASVRVRLHPDDAERVKACCPTNREGQTVALVVEPDSAMDPGGCVIETDKVIIDASIEQQLAIIHQHLTMPCESSIEPDDALRPAFTS
ncbi:MAG: hypothetical protein D6690_06555 [Nitrospirae bacterium]|nr:MAG: hypothetical protein D6690_06555 [Nitrospirota bacterium]